MNRCCLPLLASLCLAAPALAQTPVYPAKPIRVIVPFAAGGGSDLVARLVGAEITRAWGQQVVVENRTGAGGIIGAEAVARAAPDGYTLLVIEVGGLTIRPSLYPNMPFDPATDFSAVAMVAYGPNILVTHPSLPVRTTRELIALAKGRPGELNFAAPGVGSVAHLAGVEIEQAAGVKWAYIPYKGGGQAVQDLIAGQAHFAVNGMLATFPHVKSGRLRLIAVATRGRHPAIPDTPTIAETIPGHESGSKQGILGPAGLPRDIVAKWNAEIARIVATPGMKEKLAAHGSLPDPMTPDQLQKMIVSEKARWARVVQKGGVKVE